MSLTFRKFREVSMLRCKEWTKGQGDPGVDFRVLEAAEEFCEAMQRLFGLLKRLKRSDKGMVGGVNTDIDLEEEMADTFITFDLLAASLGIDLEKAITEKFNKTSRKYGLSVFIGDLDDVEPSPPEEPQVAVGADSRVLYGEDVEQAQGG